MNKIILKTKGELLKHENKLHTKGADCNEQIFKQ